VTSIYKTVNEVLAAVADIPGVSSARISYNATWTRRPMTGVVADQQAELTIHNDDLAVTSTMHVADLTIVPTYSDEWRVTEFEIGDEVPYKLGDAVHKALTAYPAPSSTANEETPS
jgi:hypothetical protein